MAQTNKKQNRWAWSLIKVSVLVFPLVPEIGGLGLLVAAIQILRQHFSKIVRQPIIWGLGVISLWLVVTSCLSPRPVDAFLGLGNFLPFFLLFMSLSYAIETPSQLRQLAWRLVIPSAIVFLLGLGQLFLGWGVPALIDPIVGAEYSPYGDPLGRMSSLFMYANLLAIYFLMVFILGIGLGIDIWQKWRVNPSKNNRWPLIFLSLIVLGDGLGLILTNSRNAWGLAFLACMVFALYLGWRSLVVGFAALASSIAVASWGPIPVRDGFRKVVPTYFWARLSDELYQDRPYALLRTTQWQFALQMMLDRPLTGWGLRNFSPMYKVQMKLWLGHPHNLFLMFMAETGIIGTILFSGWVAWILFKGVRLGIAYPLKSHADQLIFFTYLLAFGAAILFNCFDISIFDGKMNTIGWLVFSAITGIVLAAERTRTDVPPKRLYLNS